MHDRETNWREHQRSIYMRPDPKLYLRPDPTLYLRHDAHRFLPPQADEHKYSPDQPRVLAGNPGGGRWTSEGGGITDTRIPSDASPDPITPGAQYAGNGHHYVPRGVFENEKYSLRPETLQVFEKETTGSLNDPTSNRYDNLHREYNSAVEDALDRFLEKNKIRSDQMTPDQARSFAQEIKTSRDPKIRQLNMRIWMREFRFQLRRGPRGRE